MHDKNTCLCPTANYDTFLINVYMFVIGDLTWENKMNGFHTDKMNTIRLGTVVCGGPRELLKSEI